MKHFLLLYLTICLFGFAPVSFGQSVADVSDLDPEFYNWHNKDLSADGIFGASVEKAYKELLAGKGPKKEVIVAVIDGGVDVKHEDFEGKIWINDDEIAGNGKDDDNNGYIDDIHGWNFLGNGKGESVEYEHFEFVRILLTKDPSYPDYKRAEEFYEKEYKENSELRNNVSRFEQIFQAARGILYNSFEVEVNSLEDLEGITPESDQEKAAYGFLQERFEMGFEPSSLDGIKKQLADYIDYMLNKEMDYRSLVGDNPDDINDKNYGNPDVTGPTGTHGTGVAGVIGAVRGNNLGIDGIAASVKIMGLRAVPQGDEYDKDVALAIRYAVDNGADIINMSFGKDFSPNKNFVDDAVKYAEEKGVLLVHAAGNDNYNLETTENYPTDKYSDGGIASNWLEIGASYHLSGEEIAAPFSNFGKTHVDLFAPGMEIVTLDTMNTYSAHDGTSLAAPVVSGVAALVLSYYPELTVQQLKEVLMKSVDKGDLPKKVLQPGEGDKRKQVKFSTLSVSGGVVNAYKALQLAEKMTK